MKVPGQDTTVTHRGTQESGEAGAETSVILLFSMSLLWSPRRSVVKENVGPGPGV